MTELTVRNRSTSVSTMPSLREGLEAMRIDINRRVIRTASGEEKFRPGTAPTDHEKAEAVRAIGLMRRSLETLTSSSDVRKALKRLTAGLTPRENVDADALVEVMTVAVSDVPTAILDLAVLELCNGTWDPTGPVYSKKWVPTSAELATLCRAIESRWRYSLMNLERLVALPEAAPIAEPTARGQELAAKLVEKVRGMAEERRRAKPLVPATAGAAARVAAELAERRRQREAGENNG